MPQNRRSYEKTRRIALSGLLFALAMALSFIEGTLTIPGLLPGMKLGLANIVVMYALFFMGPRQALVLDVLKALFVFLVSGFTAGLLSLCGGLLSLLVMWVLYYLLPVRPTWFILSVCGALAHNIGQLLGAGVIISSSLSFYYAPVMLVLGLVMGALTSITLKALLPALGKMGFSTQEKRKEDLKISLFLTASPSPSRLTPCHLSQSERPWQYGKLSGFAKGSPFEERLPQGGRCRASDKKGNLANGVRLRGQGR